MEDYAKSKDWWQVDYNYKSDGYKISAEFVAPVKKSIVFAMGAIDINARYLNINGTVQSGVDNIELTIGKDFAPEKSSNFTDSLGNTLKGVSYGAAGLSTVDGYFDANTGTIILDDIKPTGGVINLTGTIVSTGNGEIKVASGYASINIDNQSKYALATGVVDASENRIGKVTVTDSATLKREVFTFENGNFSQQQFQGTLTPATDPNGVSSIVYTDNGITRAAFLEFNDQKTLLVFADGEDVERAGVGLILLRLFAVFLVNVEVAAQLGALPVADQKLFQVFFEGERGDVFDSCIGRNEFRGGCAADQLLYFRGVRADVAHGAD
jgi:hypothetical protein